MVPRGHSEVRPGSGCTSLGSFGDKELRLPCGLALYPEAPGSYVVFVTDNYEMVDRRGRAGQAAAQGKFTEGIVLYACGGTAGDWIATDQSLAGNTFHVFNGVSLQHLGSFRGDGTLNTDGIALTQQGFGGFPSVTFYAVPDEGNVAAFSWSEIAGRLGLRADCPAAAGAAS